MPKISVILYCSFKSFQLQMFLFYDLSMSFSMLELLLIHIKYPKKRKWPLKESFIRLYRRIIFIGQILWFLRIKNMGLKIYALLTRFLGFQVIHTYINTYIYIYVCIYIIYILYNIYIIYDMIYIYIYMSRWCNFFM